MLLRFRNNPLSAVPRSADSSRVNHCRPADDSEAPCFFSVDELAAAYRSRRLSPHEVTQAVYARIRRIDRELVAYYELAEEAALREAKASEQRWQQGAPRGPLDGVPVSIKDHIDVVGMTSPRGRASMGARRAVADSPTPLRLREAGAILVGKTTMPELPVIPVTHTQAWGITRNPLDPARMSGGSSGGAATATAAGLCTLAIGSDGGGSIRMPAAFTGLAGLKPTLGRVPYFPGQTDRTVAGPIARSIRDLAHAMNAIARPDGRDWTELPPDPVDYVDALRGSLDEVRLAYSADFGFVQVRPDIAAAVEKAVERLERAGAKIVRIGRVCDDAFGTYMTQATLRLRAEAAPPGTPRAVATPLAFARSLTPEDVQRMIDDRNRLGADFLSVFRDCDFLLSPTSPELAPRAGELYPDSDTLSPRNRNLIGFVCPVNLVHLPAASLPCGLAAEGLPAGLQIVGPKFSDARLLRLAAAIEAALAG